MNLTPTAKKVLEAVATLPNGCGANLIAQTAGIFCGKTTPLRAGQYAGKLIHAGWLHREPYENKPWIVQIVIESECQQ